ncbi:NAD(P)-binding protein [Punctularia strigosozonata HHB-11173 SS5]|uniref:NAD(P)-binding protein n=1 Tax=Punctularia strigosozonata (strain HHB-11173) TaxID=741275 RepID=UPI000441759A|nr:NAD(P)-binding protein [Punctularia strigosozonata HHB-11173 SS5]EIN05617.1 NAD(P)-binding protein [Punctularia strigosozonata HHB-11173 SS5]
MAPTEQKALVLEAVKSPFVVQTKPVSEPGSGQLIVRVEASALNPGDWKVQEMFYGLVSPGASSFQQYPLVPEGLVVKIPSNINFDEAASIPLGLATSFTGLYAPKYDRQGGGAGLTPFYEEGGAAKYVGKPFVLFGGATSMGQYAIQFARLSGFSPIIVTASEHNTDLLLSLGATHVLPRSLPLSSFASEVAKITTAPIEIVFEATALPELQRTGLDLVAPNGTLVLLSPPTEEVRESAGSKHIAHVFGAFTHPINQPLARGVAEHFPRYLEEGFIKPNRVRVLPNGLAGVEAGLELLRTGKVSGQKLVVRPQETS